MGNSIFFETALESTYNIEMARVKRDIEVNYHYNYSYSNSKNDCIVTDLKDFIANLFKYTKSS